MPSRRFLLACLLILATGLLLVPAFWVGMWVGLLLGLVPLFAAVVIILKPR